MRGRKREEKERKKKKKGGEKSTSNFLPSCWLLSDMNGQAAIKGDTIQVY